MMKLFRPHRDAAMPSSPEFLKAAESAVKNARENPDLAVAYAAHVVPIYAQPEPDEAQATAGGCAGCTYLGLWANHWPGYPPSDHGIIWLFETGIRAKTLGSLEDEATFVLLHELGHALERDHVLDEMKANGLLDAFGKPLSGHTRACG